MCRKKWCFVCLLHLCFLLHGTSTQCVPNPPLPQSIPVTETTCAMDVVNEVLQNGNREDTIKHIQRFETILKITIVKDDWSMSRSNVVVLLYRPRLDPGGLDIYASENTAVANALVSNSVVKVHLPKELSEGRSRNIVFCMVTLADGAVLGTSGELHQNRLVGLSVPYKKVYGLQEPVNITMNISATIIKHNTPSCAFFDFSTNKFNKSGCETLVQLDQGSITCSCNHLTYFGVLLVSSEVSEKDLVILTYISLIGCGLSLFTLVISFLLFITNRKMRADLSMKVHINLTVALILLNLHFLHSQVVAALTSTELCLYVAVAIHYSLLASFCWMAAEAFHLYLLLVKVFNIYIHRYLLKLSVVGWGVPAVIVSLVMIIDLSAYGRVSMDLSNPNTTAMCYIVNDTVKTVTTTGVFGIVFIFNITMFTVTVKHVVSLRVIKEHERDRTKRDVCTLLGLTTLLGITWSLVFFSFGALTTPGLYTFCILNSLQGFFIFLWFLMSWIKIRKSSAATNPSSETRSTST